MHETNSVITAVLAELLANHVTIGTIEEILTSLAEMPLAETIYFDKPMTMEIADGVTRSMIMLERSRHEAQQAAKDATPKIVNGLGEEV